MWGAYFCMGAYKHDVVVVIKMGARIHGCLFCMSWVLIILILRYFHLHVLLFIHSPCVVVFIFA